MKFPYKRCIFFLADGSRPDVFKKLLDQGELPNISKYIVEKGAFREAITSFPSTTGPAYLPYITGCHPGTCNIPGIRWFDKKNYAEKGWGFTSFRSYVGLETFLFNHDLAPQIKTAFNIFKKPISLLNMVHRGIVPENNPTRWSRIWYIYYAHLTDHWNFVDRVVTDKAIDALNKNCDFLFAVYPAIDEFSHRLRPHHDRTYQAYREFDAHVKKIVDHLKSKGWLDETLMIIGADHGLSSTTQHFDVGPFMEDQGLKTFFYTQIFKRNFKAASMVSGNGMANLYFKGREGWANHLNQSELSDYQNVLDDIMAKEAVDLMVMRGNQQNSFHFKTKKGEGDFSLSGDEVTYEWKNDEPLGLPSNGNTKKRIFTLEESLSLTNSTHFPDIFKQMSQTFSSPRSGDVIISAKSGHDLRERYEHPEHRASHGSLCPEHMKIPIITNHPIQKELFRSVDVFPTMLQLMGQPIPENIDGVSLV